MNIALSADDPAAPLAPVAEHALRLYDLSPRATATLINLSENATFRVDDPATGATMILRVHRVGYHSRAAIASELQWLMALRRDLGLEVPEPIAARDGSLVQTLKGLEVGESRFAVMFGFISGRHPAEDGLRDSFLRLGELSARMHRHARAWPLPAGFVRQTWEYQTMLGNRPIWGRWQDGVGIDGARRRLLERLCAVIERRLERFGRARDRFGLTHADVRIANLLIEDDKTKVIDFDDSGFSWYLYDVATALSFIEHRPDVPELVAAWLDGYRRAGQLSAEDEAEIPTFILLRRLLLVAWIGSRAETDLAKGQGAAFTEGACDLAEDYLRRFG
jgi:Ser/Thr protein kinase RdoA (MazF antagonist)